mgnify:CR=1 FL=1
MYVCGITPYDATHMGHAATYVGFDLLHRAWRNAGHEVTYVQNVTDVDDPLLERAAKVHVDWAELAERETQLFRDDMTALRVLPPDHYVGAVESIEFRSAASDTSERLAITVQVLEAVATEGSTLLSFDRVDLEELFRRDAALGGHRHGLQLLGSLLLCERGGREQQRGCRAQGGGEACTAANRFHVHESIATEFAENVMAMPVIRGQKTENEKFAGGLYQRLEKGPGR